MTALALLSNRWVHLALMAAVALGLGWRLMGAHEEIGRLSASLEAQKGRLEVCAAANGENLRVIKSLRGDIEALQLRRAEEARQRDEALAERDRRLADAEAAAAAERRKRRDLFRSTPDCQAFGSLRVDLACPAVADRLRERSGGHRPD